MKFSALFSAIAIACSSFAIAHHCSNVAPPFEITYLFTANLTLGTTLQPIPIPGGVQIVEQITTGTVTGPAINATIFPGLAVPTVVNNGTLQLPVIHLSGMTDDGVPFYLNEVGVGSPAVQVTRIELEIGGGEKYTMLRDGYILASVAPTADRHHVIAKGYLVQALSGA